MTAYQYATIHPDYDGNGVTAAEIAAELGVSRRTGSDICRRWIADGFLAYQDRSRKGRTYRLGPAYEALVATGG